MDLKRLNTLRDTKTSFLTLKNYDKHPCQFYIEVCRPHPWWVWTGNPNCSLLASCRQGFSLCLVWKKENYSRTSTNSHLSATATFFIPMDDNSYFNLSTTATSPQQQLPLKRVPPAKVTSPQRRQVINNGRTESIKLHFLLDMVAKLDPYPAHVVGLYFCLASLLLIYFDCVTYLHVALSTFLRLNC